MKTHSHNHRPFHFATLALAGAAFFSFAGFGWSQSNPTAQSLPYSQNFGTSTFTSLPAGWAAWLAGGNKTTQSAAETGTPGGDDTLTTATASTTTGGLYGYAVSSNAQLYLQESSSSTKGTPTVAFAFNTGSATSVTISYDLSLINGGVTTQDYGHALQYRSGTTGSFTTITGSPMTFGAVTSYTTTTRSFTVTGLTSNTDYQLRIITWRPSGSGSSKGIGIDNFSISVPVSIPTLTTPTVTSIGTTSATLGANVTANGGATLTSRGTVWGTTAAPTGNSLAEGGTATGTFTHSRTGLTANTAYVFRR